MKSLLDLESESEVAQSCPTLCNPVNYSLPGSTIYGIFEARILEFVAISFSRRSFPPRDWISVFCIVGRRFTVWATREDLEMTLFITMGHNDHDMLPKQGPCWLEICTWRLPLQRLNCAHYNCWTSTPLERNSGWIPEISHSICGLGKMDKTGLQIVRCFHVKIFSFLWAQILASSHTWRKTNVMGQCLVLVLLSSVSSRHLESSTFMHL